MAATTFQSLAEEIEDVAGLEDYLRELLPTLARRTGRPVVLYAGRGEDSPPRSTPFPSGEDLWVLSDLIEPPEGDQLDLIVESQGGQVEAVEQMVTYLRQNYRHLRCFVPHLAAGAATLLVLAADEIWLDDRGALGPLDSTIPLSRQSAAGAVTVEYVAASHILQGFERARETLRAEGQASLPAYAPLLERYDLHLFEQCHQSLELGRELLRVWLKEYMFRDLPAREASLPIRRIGDRLGKPSEFISSRRPLGLEALRDVGLKVVDTRSQGDLRELIWTLYCATALLFERQPEVYKVYANHRQLLYYRGFRRSSRRAELAMI